MQRLATQAYEWFYVPAAKYQAEDRGISAIVRNILKDALFLSAVVMTTAIVTLLVWR